LLAGAGDAAASATVSASTQSVQNALFAAGGVALLTNGPDAQLNLILNKVLQQTYELQSSLDPATAACEIGQLRSTWQSGRPASDTFLLEGPNARLINVLAVIDPSTPPAGSCAGGASPWTGPMGSALQGVAKLALDDSANFNQPGAAFNPAGCPDASCTSQGFTPSWATLDTLGTGALDPRQVLGDAARLAGLDKPFGQAWDLIWGPSGTDPFGEDVFSTPSQLLSQSPALHGAEMQSAAALISSGSLKSNVGALTTDAQNDLAAMAATTAAAMQSPGETPTTASQNSAQIDDTQAATTFLSAMAGLGDPVQGQVLAAAGAAETSIANTANDWAVAEPAPSGSAARARYAAARGDTVTGLAKAGIDLATENYFGAAMSLFNVFGGLLGGGGDGSAQSVLADEIGRLQSSLNTFASTVQADFKHLDAEIAGDFAKISSQLSTIQNELRTITNDLNTLRTDVQAVYQQIEQIHVQLDVLQANLYKTITDATSGHEFWRDVNEFIPFQLVQAQGQQMPDLSFHDAESDFFTFESQDATNGVGYAQPNPNFAPDNVFNELVATPNPIDENINYFDGWPSVVAGEIPWPSSIVNPRIWANAGQAEAELLLSNPDYVTSGQQADLAAIIGSGRTLASALSNVSAQNAATGTGNQLQNDLLSYYARYSTGTTSASVASVIGSIETAWWGHQANGWNSNYPGMPASLRTDLNLWGAANQHVSEPSITSVGCGEGTSGLALPLNGTEAVVDNTFAVAQRLGLGTFDDGCKAHWSNVTHTTSCTSSTSCTTTYLGDIAAELDWTYTTAGSSPTTLSIESITATASSNGNRFAACTLGPYNPAEPPPPCIFNGSIAGAAAAQRWTGFVEPALAAATPTMGGNVSTVATSVTSTLTSMQQDLYRTVLSDPHNYDATDGNLNCACGNLNTALVDLAGATTLIDQYAELGLAPALALDDNLRALLFGDQRLIDNIADSSDPSGRVTAMYQAAVSTPPAEDELSILTGAMDSGRSALSAELANVVGDSTVREANPLVASTIDRLSLTSTIVAWILGKAPNEPGSIIGTANLTGSPTTPVKGLCVQALNSSGNPVDLAFTNDNGAFSMFGLAPGTYTVQFTDCLHHLYLPRFYNPDPASSAAAQVTVGRAQPVALINQNTTFMVLGGQIRGSVTSSVSPGTPVARACVTASDPSTGAVVETVHATSAGTYMLGSLAPGSYNVAFSDCVNREYLDGSYGSNPVTVKAGAVTGNINALLAPAPPHNSVHPPISGIRQDGHTLSAKNGTWSSVDAIIYTYQWRRCSSTGTSCVNVSGASAQTYHLTSADVGHQVSVTVTATNAEGSNAASATPVGPVAAPAPPTNTTLPRIGGTVQAGHTLTASVGGWTSPDALALTYQWKTCSATGTGCTNLPVTTKTYKLTSTDVGHDITVVVTATDQEGQRASATAAPVGPVAAAA
jgi:hypothetical protein